MLVQCALCSLRVMCHERFKKNKIKAKTNNEKKYQLIIGFGSSDIFVLLKILKILSMPMQKIFQNTII